MRQLLLVVLCDTVFRRDRGFCFHRPGRRSAVVGSSERSPRLIHALLAKRNSSTAASTGVLDLFLSTRQVQPVPAGRQLKRGVLAAGRRRGARWSRWFKHVIARQEPLYLDLARISAPSLMFRIASARPCPAARGRGETP